MVVSDTFFATLERAQSRGDVRLHYFVHDRMSTCRRLADGERSFLVRSDAKAALVVFEESWAETELAQMSQSLPDAELEVVRRVVDGTVRLLDADRIMTWDGTSWTVRPNIVSALADGLDELGLERCDTAHTLVTLVTHAVHDLAAARIGATIVWSRAQTDTGSRSFDASSMLRLGDLDFEDDYAAIRHLLAHSDGALLVNPDGIVEAACVELLAEPETAEVVPTESGTRHTSAKRFSYQEPDSVVVVVSADGPVSVFARGRKIRPWSDPVFVEVVVTERRRRWIRLADRHCADGEETLVVPESVINEYEDLRADRPHREWWMPIAVVGPYRPNAPGPPSAGP